MKALLLALFAVLVVTQVIHQKRPGKRVVSWHWTFGGDASDCVREGLDAYGLAHPNGGKT